MCVTKTLFASLVQLALNCCAIIITAEVSIITVRGELQVHNQPDTLGRVIKAAREKIDITIEVLAEKTGITERYLYRIENEGKKPSFDVLCRLIRELSISSDLIFYPEKSSKDSEVEDLLRILYRCDKRSLEVVKATATALIDITLEK